MAAACTPTATSPAVAAMLTATFDPLACAAQVTDSGGSDLRVNGCSYDSSSQHVFCFKTGSVDMYKLDGDGIGSLMTLNFDPAPVVDCTIASEGQIVAAGTRLGIMYFILAGDCTKSLFRVDLTGGGTTFSATQVIEDQYMGSFNGVDVAVSDSLVGTVKNDGRFCTVPNPPIGGGADTVDCTDPPTGRLSSADGTADSFGAGMYYNNEFVFFSNELMWFFRRLDSGTITLERQGNMFTTSTNDGWSCGTGPTLRSRSRVLVFLLPHRRLQRRRRRLPHRRLQRRHRRLQRRPRRLR